MGLRDFDPGLQACTPHTGPSPTRKFCMSNNLPAKAAKSKDLTLRMKVVDQNNNAPHPLTVTKSPPEITAHKAH